MSQDSLQALLVEELQALYYGEKHLLQALPRMARASSTPELGDAFTAHAARTEEHVARLKRAFTLLGVEAVARKCHAVDGLVQQVAEMMEASGDPVIHDVALIAGAHRMAHYEIAAYGNARRYAEALGHEHVVTLLALTLNEAQEAELALGRVEAEVVLPAALLVGAVVGPATVPEGNDDISKARRQASLRGGPRAGRGFP